MNTLAFLENIQIVTNAPEGMKQVRRAILQLAIRGALVEQRSNESAATALLEQIVQHRAALGSNDRHLASAPTIEQTPSAPHKVPSSWKWVFLGDIVINRDGERVPVSKEHRSKRTREFDYYGAS